MVQTMPSGARRAALNRQSGNALEAGLQVVVTSAVACALIILPLATHAFELLEAQEERSVSLTVGSGQLVRTDSDFSDVFVADPDVADVQVTSSRLLYLTGTGVGETALFALDDDDQVLMSAVVRVDYNARALSTALQQVAPDQPVRAQTIDNSLVMTGRVRSPEQAEDVMRVARQFAQEERIINRLEIEEPTQVNLQVRIAEVSRNMDRQLGIRWNELGVGSRTSLSGGSGVDGGYGLEVARNPGNINVNVVLEALAEEGLVAILAEPNLTARTGEPASFLAGGEFPFRTGVDEDGTPIIDFKDFGVGLSFTPTVLDGNRISLNVATEVSDLDFTGPGNVPALSTRRAETTVDLASGQSFAIAGLIENTSSQDVARVPGLGSIPILGALFRSSGFQRQQTELVILVTPVIVEPSHPDDMTTPVDGFTPPNDFERILLGRFQGGGDTPNRVGERRLHGSAGFTFE